MKNAIRIISVAFGFIAVSSFVAACGSYAPVKTPGNCAMERHWEASQKDENGDMKEGYYAWDDGKAPGERPKP